MRSGRWRASESSRRRRCASGGRVGPRGVLLALPELLSQGLLEVADDVYGRLKSGFFGLHSVLLTLTFMALLRIKTPE